MKILRIPTYWTAEQADTVYEFLGELRTQVWQQYHEEIQLMYEEVKNEQALVRGHERIDDDMDF